MASSPGAPDLLALAAPLVANSVLQGGGGEGPWPHWLRVCDSGSVHDRRGSRGDWSCPAHGIV
eukprot:8779264-Alexandrium_andersonii.AAC.1